MDRASHWNRVYGSKPHSTVSWYQPNPERSLATLQRWASTSQKVLDVGGGASLLVDGLLDAGYERPVVLDVSAAALEQVKTRLGPRAGLVDWVVADITSAPVLPKVHLWHDRAVCHFLTEAQDQAAYAELAAKTVHSGGWLVIACFALGGPERCSGLAVQRHDGASLSVLLGPEFDLLEQSCEVHTTPTGTGQAFVWTVFRRQ